MTTTITWETDLKNALARAQKEKRPVFLDFFHSG